MSKRRSLDQLDKFPTVLAREGTYVGALDGRENYVVHGRVQGNCDIEGMLLVGPDCLWVGNICADVVIVKGRIEGDVRARFKLELRASARINGNLSSPLVAVAEGATVSGTVSPDSIVSRFSERRMH